MLIGSPQFFSDVPRLPGSGLSYGRALRRSLLASAAVRPNPLVQDCRVLVNPGCAALMDADAVLSLRAIAVETKHLQAGREAGPHQMAIVSYAA
jgi:hypothetical protein